MLKVMQKVEKDLEDLVLQMKEKEKERDFARKMLTEATETKEEQEEQVQEEEEQKQEEEQEKKPEGKMLYVGPWQARWCTCSKSPCSCFSPLIDLSWD